MFPFFSGSFQEWHVSLNNSRGGDHFARVQTDFIPCPSIKTGHARGLMRRGKSPETSVRLVQELESELSPTRLNPKGSGSYYSLL